MKKKGSGTYKPSRRNKNIGTEKQGFKARNDFGIPDSFRDSRIFFEKLKNPIRVPCLLDHHEFSIFVEPTLKDYKHFVSVEDVLRVFQSLPKDHIKGIKSIIFRQPTRKEAIFSPVWGRLVYWADLGSYSGPSIILEAQSLNFCKTYNGKVDPFRAEELERLRNEGHEVNVSKNSVSVLSTPLAVRQTQLYRTFVHEIGHYVDYMEKYSIPAERCSEEEKEILFESFHSRPIQEKERYAERYVKTANEKLLKEGLIPFDPITLDTEAFPLLNPNWFYFSSQIT